MDVSGDRSISIFVLQQSKKRKSYWSPWPFETSLFTNLYGITCRKTWILGFNYCWRYRMHSKFVNRLGSAVWCWYFRRLKVVQDILTLDHNRNMTSNTWCWALEGRGRGMSTVIIRNSDACTFHEIKLSFFLYFSVLFFITQIIIFRYVYLLYLRLFNSITPPPKKLFLGGKSIAGKFSSFLEPQIYAHTLENLKACHRVHTSSINSLPRSVEFNQLFQTIHSVMFQESLLGILKSVF
jgi:hypothetical protein